MERADEIARLETLHNGKPIFESRHIEMPAAPSASSTSPAGPTRSTARRFPVKGNFLTYTLREPVGVVAAIVPWNFPLLLTAWKVAPALACGNTVIIKPASQTPLTALALAEIAHEVGVPPGVLNVITGPGSQVGQMLVEHPGIDKIAFTGDTSTGKGIMRGRRRDAEAHHARAGRQVAEHRLSPTRISTRRPRRDDGHLLRQGRSVRRRIAAARRQVDQGRVHRQGRRAGEEDGARRSAGSQDAPGRDLVEEAARERSALHRDREEGRREARRRRRRADIGTGQGLLPAADGVRRRDAAR